MDNIKSENHQLAFFKIYDKPKEYVDGGDYGTLVNHEKDMRTEEGKTTFVVTISGKQLIENVQALAVINSVSSYELVEPIGNIIPMSFWQPLVFKSIEECNKLYKENVKGTYLEGTDIPSPTLEELGG